MHNKTKSKRREDKSDNFLLKIFIGVLIGCIVFFVGTALYAMLSLKIGGEESYYKVIGWIIGFFSGASAGFASVRTIKEKGVLFGGVTGLLVSVIIASVLFIVNNSSAGRGIFILMPLMVAGGIAGGITAVNLKIKKKY